MGKFLCRAEGNERDRVAWREMFDDVEIANGRALVRWIRKLGSEEEEFHVQGYTLKLFSNDLTINLKRFLRRAFPRKGSGAFQSFLAHFIA